MQNTEEIRYCSACGAANKKSATQCCACEKDLNLKGSPFVTYIKDHIKDNLQDTVNENIFSLIKNFLLSHLYGTVLTVCVVATVAMSAYAARLPAGTERVRMHPEEAFMREEMQDDEGFAEDTDWSETALTEAWDFLAGSYESYAHEQGMNVTDIKPPACETLFAETLPGYTHTGKHDFAYNELYNTQWPSPPVGTTAITAGYAWDFDTLRYGENLQTPLGKQLQKEGYTAAEIVYTGHVAFCYPESDEELAQKAVLSIPYQFVFVKSDGEWYIASDERI